MGKQVRGLLYLFATDSRRSIITFWIIFLSTMALSLFAAALFNSPNMRMFFWLPMPLYIYCGVFGFIMAKQAIPFSIKIGATRKSIFTTVILFFAGLAVLESLLINCVDILIGNLVSAVKLTSFHVMHPFEQIGPNWLSTVLIDSVVLFFLLTSLFAFGLLFYRYGLIGGGSLSGLVLVFLIIAGGKGWITDFGSFVYRTLSLTTFLYLFGIAIIVYGLSWLLLRRAAISKPV